jgi:hypothetical protein
VGGSGGAGGGSGACTIDDTSGCTAGSTIEITDGNWSCDQPLAAYAAQAGGTLPLKVILHYTTVVNDNGGVDLTTGCAGDSDPRSIDLILDVHGDGLTVGTGVDAIKVRLEAGYNNSIQITGHADCGPRMPGAHQDGVQAQGGRDVTFVDFTLGDYDRGLSTCMGAGGAFFYSSANGNYPTNVNVIRGKWIACNHGLFGGAQNADTGTVTGARFRTGRVDGTDPVCIGLNKSPACSTTSSIVQTDLTCESWDPQTLSWR